MKIEDIFEKINEEKNEFLKKFENEDVFIKSSKNPLKIMPCSEDQATFILLTFLLTLMTSLSVLSMLVNFLTLSHNINLFLSFIITPFISTLFLRQGIFVFLKHQYKFRNKNNVIQRYFEHQFYETEISTGIHNMLKLYLSDKEYIDLRNQKDIITYKIVEPYIKDIQKNEKLLSEKKEIFLTPEEITKYNYVKS